MQEKPYSLHNLRQTSNDSQHMIETGVTFSSIKNRKLSPRWPLKDLQLIIDVGSLMHACNVMTLKLWFKVKSDVTEASQLISYRLTVHSKPLEPILN